MADPLGQDVFLDPDQDDFQFALSPALVSNQAISYATSAGAKLFKGATTPLEPAFDLKPENLVVFLANLANRSDTYGWTLSILSVPPDLNQPDRLISIPEQYGQITLEQIRAYVTTYINGQTRAAQDDWQLYLCLKESLTPTAKAAVLLATRDFTVNGRRSGAALLKVIIDKAYLDTHATTRIIRENLTQLDTYMVSVNHDVRKFNDHVQTQLDALAARGETVQDLVSKLLKGYSAVKDKAFERFIELENDAFNETGTKDPRVLMDQALKKMETLKQTNKWMIPSSEESQIIALQAELNKLKSSKTPKKASTKPAASKSDKQESGDKTEGNKTKSSRQSREKPAWMLVAPKAGEAKTKEVGEKTYHWCPTHASWVRHKPSECLGKGGKSPNSKPPPKPSSGGSGGADKALKISEALAAIINRDDA